MHLLLVGLARGLQNRVIRVRVLSDAPICSYSLTERISVYGTEDGGSIPLASTMGRESCGTLRLCRHKRIPWKPLYAQVPKLVITALT